MHIDVYKICTGYDDKYKLFYLYICNGCYIATVFSLKFSHVSPKIRHLVANHNNWNEQDGRGCMMNIWIISTEH